MKGKFIILVALLSLGGHLAYAADQIKSQTQEQLREKQRIKEQEYLKKQERERERIRIENQDRIKEQMRTHDRSFPGDSSVGGGNFGGGRGGGRGGR